MAKETIGAELLDAIANFNDDLEKKEFIDKSSSKKGKNNKQKKEDSNKNDIDKTLVEKDPVSASEEAVDPDSSENEAPKRKQSKNSDNPSSKDNKTDEEPLKQEPNKINNNNDVTIRNEEFPPTPAKRASKNGHNSKHEKNLILKSRLKNANKKLELALVNIDTGEIIPIRHSALIGKAGHCDISLDEKYVSKEHAKIIKKDGSFEIEDLNSTNGTKVNGKKIKGIATASENDVVSFANVKFKIQKVEV